MKTTKLIRIVSVAASAAGALAYARYRRDMKALRAAVDGGGTIAETVAGPIEYAEAGQGMPTLVIHGAGGGYDQGLLIGRDLGEGFRVIAPSRFGYLKTPVPADASAAAQADAHDALLDFLDVRKALVVGVSAGAPSAIELALRHPGRISGLVLLVPRTFDPTQTMGVDQSAESQAVLSLVERSADFLFWAAMHAARRSVVRFLGIPPELEAKAPEEERRRVTEVMRSILPLSARIRGIAIDSSLELSAWPLEQIRVPTLVVSAKDDLFRTLPGAKFTAERINGARLEVLETGGHLMLGRNAQVREAIARLLHSDTSQACRAAEAQRALEPA